MVTGLELCCLCTLYCVLLYCIYNRVIKYTHYLVILKTYYTFNSLYIYTPTVYIPYRVYFEVAFMVCHYCTGLTGRLRFEYDKIFGIFYLIIICLIVDVF